MPQVTQKPKSASGGRAGPEILFTLTVIGELKPLMAVKNAVKPERPPKVVSDVGNISMVKVGGGGFTVNVRDAVCTMLPLVAVRLIAYVAAGVAKSVGTVTLKAVWPLPAGAKLIEFALKVGAGPPTPLTTVGEMVACRLTVPVNPPRDCPNKLNVAVEPAAIV